MPHLTSFYLVLGKLTGMNENTGTVDLPDVNLEPKSLCNKIYETANVLQVGGSEENRYRFAGKTIVSGSDVLVTVKIGDDNKAKITVNCDKMVIGSMLMKDLKTNLVKE